MKVILILIMLVGGLFGLENGSYNVIKIVDGDTIDIATPVSIESPLGKTRIRLAFIDTMESTKNKRAKTLSAKCNIDILDIVEDGKDSKRYLMELILTKNINVVFYGKDSTGLRTVGELFLPGDEESVNIKMIKYGKGLPYYTYIRKFKKDVLFYKNIIAENESYVTADICVKSSLGK